jgi:hypothetical protein
MTEAGKKALVLGATGKIIDLHLVYCFYIIFMRLYTGAVGKALLRDVLVANTYKSVTAIGRRDVTLDESVPQDKLVCKTLRALFINRLR